MVENSKERKLTSSKNHVNKESNTMLNENTIELNFVRNRLETFQDTILRDVEKRMRGMIDEVMQELWKRRLQTNEFRNFAPTQILYNNNINTWTSRTLTTSDTVKTAVNIQEDHTCDEDREESTTNKEMYNDAPSKVPHKGEVTKAPSTKKHRVLPDKVFMTRESYLTALLEVDHMKTIYHIFYIIFTAFLFNNISYEYFVKGRVSFGMRVFRGGFENINTIAVISIIQHIFVICIYIALRGWSHVRAKLLRHKTLQHLWSISCLLIYISTQLLFVYVPTKICVYLNLPFVTASVLLLETVRLLMKMHSFVRTVTPRVLAGKLKDNEVSVKQIVFPTFNKYLYYLFAPTLLYRDEYPRTSTIRWKFAVSRLLEIVSVAFLYSYIYERHIEHYFGNFGIEEINVATMIIKLFGMLMPSMVLYLCGFYMILHAWLNFTAELLQFGDRMFYRDWWTAGNYEAYYRNWNVVVHDWLYEYIYKDCYYHVFKGSKVLSSLTVFTVSAIFHEYVLGYALQVIFPVIFAFFGGVGVLLVFLTRYIPKNIGNFLLWFSLIYGSSWIISLYSMEYFARINCPKEFDSWTEYLVPHMWSCYAK